MEWLTGPLPDDKELVTLGVTEPFTVSVKVSFIAALAISSADHPLADLGVPGTRARATLRASRRLVRDPRHGAVRHGRRLHVLRRPAAGAGLPTSYDDNLYNIQIRANYYYTFAALTLLAGGIAFLLPIFVLGLVRLRVVTTQRLRRNRRIAYVLLAFAILLPTVDPVSLAFEVVPLVVLYELSIWLSS